MSEIFCPQPWVADIAATLDEPAQCDQCGNPTEWHELDGCLVDINYSNTPDSNTPAEDDNIWLEADINPDAIVFDGFDDAIIGWGHQYPQTPVLVYSSNKIIESLICEGELSEEDAIDYFEFNIRGLYAGEHTPIIVDELG